MLKPNTFFQLKLLVFHNFFSERPGEIPYLKKITLKPGLPGVRLDTPPVNLLFFLNHAMLKHGGSNTYPQSLFSAKISKLF